MRLMHVSERVLLTLWVGSMWTVGYLAVPVLFRMLDDRRLAGTLAGEMFSAVGTIGLAAGAVLLAGALYVSGRRWFRSWRIWALVAMLLLVALGDFVLRPAIADLRGTGLVEGSEAAAHFARLHGLASALYLLNSLLGLALVVFGVAPNRGSGLGSSPSGLRFRG